ncbi:MAG: DUF2189 domain-containing protein [Alphaproteobacteria bacterium]|nr:DUF2189 domain-containing protein [Alphaproteobacteria bacterium]
MAYPDAAGSAAGYESAVPSPAPAIRRIGMADLGAALKAGWEDFLARPSFAVFVALIYPIVGLFLLLYTVGYDFFPLLFPLAAGFALLGPVAAVGFYEISRRREQGLDSSWRHALDVFRSPSFVPIAALAGWLAALFILWLFTAWMIYQWCFPGQQITDIPAFLGEVLTTAAGWKMMLAGNLAGLAFAVAALVLGAVSFPLLVDKDAGFDTALRTSVRAAAANPAAMAAWGAIVAGLLVLGTLPLFMGLAVVLPVLGHATWHLYRRIVAW